VIAGSEQTKQEIVLNMLRKNMEEKLISEITGIPVDKVKEIKGNHSGGIH
jgi:hypothetical protein